MKKDKVLKKNEVYVWELGKHKKLVTITKLKKGNKFGIIEVKNIDTHYTYGTTRECLREVTLKDLLEIKQ